MTTLIPASLTTNTYMTQHQQYKIMQLMLTRAEKDRCSSHIHHIPAFYTKNRQWVKKNITNRTVYLIYLTSDSATYDLYRKY